MGEFGPTKCFDFRLEVAVVQGKSLIYEPRTKEFSSGDQSVRVVSERGVNDGGLGKSREI